MDRYHAGRTEQDTGGKGGIGRTLRDLLVADIRFSSTLGPFAAQDLTQSFFGDFMEREALTHVDRLKARRAGCLKRGGAAEFVSLDTKDAEDRYVVEPAKDLTPENFANAHSQ
jgi:hypothetical protein